MGSPSRATSPPPAGAQIEIQLPDLQHCDGHDESRSSQEEIQLRPGFGGESRSPPTERISMFWLGIGFSAHMSWGLFPVFARHLQHFRGYHGIVVLTTCYMIALSLQTVTLIIRGKFTPKVPDNMKIGIPYFLLCIGRGTTNILCVRYTEAMYAQIVTNFTPFLVAFLTCFFISRDSLPRFIFPALIGCFICASVVILTQSHEVSDSNHDVSDRILSAIGFDTEDGSTRDRSLRQNEVVGSEVAEQAYKNAPAEFTGQVADEKVWGGKGERNDVLGLCMAGVSIFFSACMRMIMKFSGNAGMPETSLMAWRYMNFLPLLIYIQLYLADEQEHFWTTATKSDFCVVLLA